MPFQFVRPRIDHPRTRRAFVLLLGLWGLGLCDYLFTIWAQRFTQFQEVNPWAGLLLSHHQFLSLAVGKAILTVFATFIFWTLRKRSSTQVALWALFVVHAALMVRWATYTSSVLALGDVAGEGPRYLSALPAISAEELKAAAARLAVPGERPAGRDRSGEIALISPQPQD